MTSSTLTTGFVVGQVIVAIGCVMLMLGPFLEWVSYPPGFEACDKYPDGWIIHVILGAIGLALAVASLYKKRQTWAHVAVQMSVGVLCLGFGFYVFVWMITLGGGDFPDPAYDNTPEIGFYLSVAGSVLVLVGACVAAANRMNRMPGDHAGYSERGPDW